MLALNLLPSKTIPKTKIIGIKIAKLKKYAKKNMAYILLMGNFFLPANSAYCKTIRHV
jgi:hypothetical protein